MLLVNILVLLIKKCNLKLQVSAEKIRIPVIFHNLKGYDSHFTIQKLTDEYEKIPITVIPNNTEKYMAFTLVNISIFLIAFNS